MRRLLWFILFIWGGSSFSQDTNMVQKPFSSNILSYNKPTSSISFSGYYRFLGFVRNQQETFPNNSGKTFVINSGDYYREPMFLLRLNGKTRDNITFGADLMLNSLYKGPSPDFTQKLTLNLGLSHPVEIEVPENITIKMDGNTKFIISSPDKQKLGEFAAMVRSKRPPEPFKGKGIRYSNEYILRKEGKKK